MNGKVEKCDYSDNETLIKAIELIKKGSTEEEVQRKMNLSNEDMNLIVLGGFGKWLQFII